MNLTQYPKLSVVTPSYNQAPFIEETIHSVLDQDYPNLEYIIVDGGSTDGSVDIIRRYSGRLAWWVSEKDRGQTDAINKGFARATGNIFAWINSDDTYEPRAVGQAVKYLTEHSEAGMVYADCNYINEEGRVIGRSPPPRIPTCRACPAATSTSRSKPCSSARTCGSRVGRSTRRSILRWITTC